MENDFLFELGLRGFLGVHDYDIRVPKDRRLTFLTGPNGYGKTEILRTLDWIAGEANPSNELIMAHGIHYKDAGREYFFDRDKDGNWVVDTFLPFGEWAAAGHGKPLFKRLFFPLSDMQEFNLIRSVMTTLADAWDERPAVKFREILERYNPGAEIIRESREALVRYRKSGREVPFLNLSDGEKSLVVLLYRILFLTTPGMVHLVDNPTLFMHVAWELELAGTIEECLELNDGYALIATHSPQLIAGRYNDCIDLWCLENPHDPAIKAQPAKANKEV